MASPGCRVPPLFTHVRTKNCVTEHRAPDSTCTVVRTDKWPLLSFISGIKLANRLRFLLRAARVRPASCIPLYVLVNGLQFSQLPPPVCCPHPGQFIAYGLTNLSFHASHEAVVLSLTGSPANVVTTVRMQLTGRRYFGLVCERRNPPRGPVLNRKPCVPQADRRQIRRLRPRTAR